MTEKRFTMDNESDISEFNWENNEYIDDFMWSDGKSWDRLCNRLNELYVYDEIKKLKEENEELKREIKKFKKLWVDTFMENAKLKEKIDKSNKKFVKKMNTISKTMGLMRND